MDKGSHGLAVPTVVFPRLVSRPRFESPELAIDLAPHSWVGYRLPSWSFFVFVVGWPNESGGRYITRGRSTA